MTRFFDSQTPKAASDTAHGSVVPEASDIPSIVLPTDHSDPSTVRIYGEEISQSDTCLLGSHDPLESRERRNRGSEKSSRAASSGAGELCAASLAHAEAMEAIVASPTASPCEKTQTHSRHDAITGRWTIFAVGRDERPNDYAAVAPLEPVSFQCPFCAGHEEQTPPSVLEIDSSECESMSLASYDEQGNHLSPRRPWAIRVIPNKFPAVDGISQEPVTSDPAAVAHKTKSRRDDPTQSLFRSRVITGGHEVFIESPSHDHSLVTLDLAQATMLFRAYQLRMSHWRKVPSICYVSLFKNSGPAAGASLHHSHSQLIATTELPFAAKAVADRMKLHWAKTGCCLQCDLVRAEIKAKVRVVASTDSLVAYCPFGSHLPMLLRITTRRHLDCYESLTMSELEELAKLVRRCIRWMQKMYPDVAYNYLIHTRPPGVGGEDMAHWALELFPRVSHVAGFEWSSDCLINPMLPETAAAKYRAIARDENPLR